MSRSKGRSVALLGPGSPEECPGLSGHRDSPHLACPNTAPPTDILELGTHADRSTEHVAFQMCLLSNQHQEEKYIGEGDGASQRGTALHARAGPEQASLSKYLRTDSKDMRDWAMQITGGSAFPARETASVEASRLGCCRACVRARRKPVWPGQRESRNPS